MKKTHSERRITLELLPDDEAGIEATPSQQAEGKSAGIEEDAPRANASQIPPLPSLPFNISALLSGIDNEILDSLESFRLPKVTHPELDAAKTLRGGFGRLPSVDKPLFSANSLSQVQKDLLGDMKQEQWLSDLKKFVIVECRKDMTSMEVICDQDGSPAIVELPSAIANVAFPLANSSSAVRRDMELRYVPLKAQVPGRDVVVSAPSLGLSNELKGASVEVAQGKKDKERKEAKKKMAKPKSRQGGQDGNGPPVIGRLQDIRRFKDGLTIDTNTNEFIRATIDSKTTQGRKRGRTGDIPADWDEPTDEEILANLLLSHPPMKLWGAVELKKEIRKVRNRFSAELSRVRKKPQQR